MLRPTIKIVLISTVIFGVIICFNMVKRETDRIKDYIFIINGNALMLDKIELTKNNKILNIAYYEPNKMVEIIQHREYIYNYGDYNLKLHLGEVSLINRQLFLFSSDYINVCESDLSVNFNDQPIEFICKEKRNGYLIKIYYDDNPELKWDIGSNLQFSFFNKNNQQVKIPFTMKDNQMVNMYGMRERDETFLAKVFYWWYDLEDPDDTYYFDDY